MTKFHQNYPDFSKVIFMNTFDNLKSFISDHWAVNKEDLKRTTMIEDDLKITGDDAVEFIIAYGKRFNVDISNFKTDKYFDYEGDKLFLIISRLLFSRKRRDKSLTIEDLEKGIQSGRLDEEVINGS